MRVILKYTKRLRHINKLILVLLICSIATLFYLNKNLIRKGMRQNPQSTLECDGNLKNLAIRREINLTHLTTNELIAALKHLNVEHGGCWKPKNCTSKSNIAIIIPFRNREENLNIFLLNMLPLFAKQQLSYCIYLIEPVKKIKFNRGILMNIGFVESNIDADDTWQCYAFHDVDLLSENEQTSYHCPTEPNHLAVRINKFNYTPIYKNHFGGVNTLNKEDFLKVNGFSNMYFDWGSEDDDFADRVMNSNFTIRPPDNDTNNKRYYMLNHDKQPINPIRVTLYDEGPKRAKIDGLNSLKYVVTYKRKSFFYTKVYVYYDEKQITEDVSKRKL